MVSLRSLRPGFGTALRLTVTSVVWGLAIFLIFSVPLWEQSRQLEALQTQAQGYAPPLQSWLANLTAPLERFAADPRSRAGLGLKGGLNSLPVQRALAEAAVYFSTPDLVMVETRTKATAMAPGASPLPEEILPRLKELESTGTFRTLLAVGKRSGLVYAALQLEETPPDMDVWVLTSLTLSQMAAHWPELKLPEGANLSLVLPHTEGFALWDPDTAELTLPAPLQAPGALQQRGLADPHAATLTGFGNLSPWQGLKIALITPRPAAQGAGLQLLILLVTMGLTMALWWSSPAPAVHALRTKLEGLLQRLTPLLGKVNTLLHTAPRLKKAPALPEPATAHAHNKAPDAPLPDWPDPAPKDEPPLEKAEPATLSEPRKKRRWKSAGSEAPPPSPTLREKPSRTLEDPDDMLEILKTCLKENLLELHYQPIYRVEDSMPVLHEVFARLIHPGTGNLILPGAFLPTAIRHNMTLQLDLAVFKKVYQTHFLGAIGPATPLALNISSTSLDGLDYMKEMAIQGAKVLQKLAFEVRSQEMARDSRALKLLKEIQHRGGNLAVDYFGGGAEMLKASKQVGFDYVKIDSSAILAEPNGKDILKTLCQEGNALGLPVILEKVGDQPTEMMARRAGATYMQGFGLASPAKTLQTTPLPPRMAGLAAIVDSGLTEGS